VAFLGGRRWEFVDYSKVNTCDNSERGIVMTVTVDLTPDQVTQLNKLASATGRGTDQLMQEAVENLLSYNKWFEEQVQIGQAQIQRGDLLEDEEVRARIDRMFRP
jgi:predicted transcriptional regulator